MPTFVVILLLLAAVIIAAVTLVVVQQRKRLGSERGDQGSDSCGTHVERQGESPVVEDSEDADVLAVATEHPNEFFLLGSAIELDRYGSTRSAVPTQLTKHATRLRVGVDAARSIAEQSGRLVLVDDKTAAALRAGTMMRSKGGEILAHTMRADGKVASVTRLRQVGGIAAGAASLTNVLSAMATQAQLDRIERQLAEISDGIDAVNRELLREWHATTRGAQDALREVYRTAATAGELTKDNWDQVATIGHVVRSQINGDRDRLESAVRDLEHLATVRDLKQRKAKLETCAAAVASSHAALAESSRAWAQYSALRLWRFSVTDDPSVEAYRQELLEFIEISGEEIGHLGIRASGVVGRIAEHRWTSRLRHPMVARQLPGASVDGLTKLGEINWRPLQLGRPSVAVELFAQAAPKPAATENSSAT